jgi:soluble lytic murein transglycosylase-like protein
MARFRILRVAMCLSGVLLTVLHPFGARAGVVSAAPAARSHSASRVESFATFVAEASRRFAIPAHWIRAVMLIESGGDDRAISAKGAIGLMQIGPRTWVELIVRNKLGIDPFDPRDNILAGTAYLREMHGRFGSQGFLAAYNAGPERYEQHLATARPLPPETQAYVAALTPLIDPGQESVAAVANRAASWRQPSLFVEQFGNTFVVRSKSQSKLPTPDNSSALGPRATGLFVRRSSETPAR